MFLAAWRPLPPPVGARGASTAIAAARVLLPVLRGRPGLLCAAFRRSGREVPSYVPLCRCARGA